MQLKRDGIDIVQNGRIKREESRGIKLKGVREGICSVGRV